VPQEPGEGILSCRQAHGAYVEEAWELGVCKEDLEKSLAEKMGQLLWTTLLLSNAVSFFLEEGMREKRTELSLHYVLFESRGKDFNTIAGSKKDSHTI
jgi:hypothetical protein